MSRESETLRKRRMEEDAAWEEHWKRNCEIKAKWVEEYTKKLQEERRKEWEEERRRKEEEYRKKRAEEVRKKMEEYRKEEKEEFLKSLFMSDEEGYEMIRQWILEGRLEVSVKFRRLIQEVLKYDDAVKGRKLAESKSSAALLINQNPSNVISGSKDCQCSAADASHTVGNVQTSHDDDKANEKVTIRAPVRAT